MFARYERHRASEARPAEAVRASEPRSSKPTLVYYRLTKPRMVYGNLLIAAAGFFLASHGSINLVLLVAMQVGLSCIVASACVFNNYIDRDIDAKMERTKDRALVTREVPTVHALVFATALGILGGTLLILHTTHVAFLTALFGFIVYVFVYSFAKRSTVFSTHIGALAGAMPPVVGYTAVTGNLDAGALTLFLILFIWQVPHFLSIAIYHEDDYRAAGIPVRPIQSGIFKTKLIIALYCGAFCFAIVVPTIIGQTGYVYADVLALTSIAWFCLAIAGFSATDDRRWARRMFLFSLAVITTFSLMIILNQLVQLP